MTRAEEINNAFFAFEQKKKQGGIYCPPTTPNEELRSRLNFTLGVQWADANPSDETIMRILNCIGYEEKSWVEFVRKELEKRKEV